MKVNIKITYDDRKRKFGNLQLFTHREAIGVNGDQEKSVAKNFFPNPGEVKSLVSAFPYEKGHYFVANIELEGTETLVNTNRENLSQLGQELIDKGIGDVLKELFEKVTSIKDKGLIPTRYCIATYEWENGDFELLSAAVYTIDPSNPNRKLKVSDVEV